MAEGVEVPEGWRRISIEKDVILISGLRPKGGASEDEGVPSLGGEHITTDGRINFTDQNAKYIPEKFYKLMKKGIVKEYDILMNKDGANTGKVAILKEKIFPKIVINEHLFIIRSRKYFEHKHLFYWLLSNFGQKQIKDKITGSAQPGLSSKFTKNFFVLKPPLPEQRKIAEILETVDNAIERTDTIIEKYKRIKQGLMQDLLTRGVVENDELGVMNYELRDEKKHRFKDSPLGRIPEEWEVVELMNGIGGNANLIVAGPFGSNLKVLDYKKTGIPIIRLQNIDENKFIDKDIKFISDKKAKELSYHSFKSGDLILAKLGDPIGKTCIVPNIFKYGIVVADVVRIRVNEQYADKRFISYILNFDICRNQLNTDIIGTTRPRVNLDQIRNAKVPLPPLSEQHRIASILSQMDQTIEKEQKYKQKLERIKQGLMEDLLTGKVKVNYELGVMSYEL